MPLHTACITNLLPKNAIYVKIFNCVKRIDKAIGVVQHDKQV